MWLLTPVYIERGASLLLFPSQYGTVPRKRRSYSVNELRDLAAGLRRLLREIEDGSLAADAGTISRLEGAAAAIQALAEGGNPLA
jgi:hypothetical protein